MSRDNIMKKVSILILLFGLFLSVSAQDKRDVEAIKNMCGCYEVTFRYAETFTYGADSTYVPSKASRSKALEWVELAEEKKDKLVLQHLLIVGRKESQHVVKHWRQDWIFQNTDFYTYNIDDKWDYSRKTKPQVKGQWTQKVFQVDDSPRYEQSATWVHVDGKSFWESEVTSPLPRREQEIRSDYNVFFRRNRHEITDYGWLHEQDNDKIIRQIGKDDMVIAQEKGYNTYKKVDDEKCEAARVYWQKNKTKWNIVRTQWDKVFGRNTNLRFADKVEGKSLFEYLFDEENYKTEESIKQIISKFVSQGK